MTTVSSRWTGTGVAPGTAVAASWRVDRPIQLGAGPLDPNRVEQAFRDVAGDLNRVANRARAQGRRAVADIVAVGAVIATDPGLVDAAWRAATGDDPLHGIHDAVEEYARMLESLPDEMLRERAADVRQVGRRVIERLARTGSATPTLRRFVLVAEDLGPADLLEHLGQGLAGAVTVRGGANSHAAIVARSVGLPLVVGVDPEVLDLPDSTSLLVDADAGAVVADPPYAEVARADEATARDGQRRGVLATDRGRLHVTADGQPFGLLCNVASDTEVRVGRESGAEGIGLLRTELPFLHADRWPTDADHRRALRPILADTAGWPVTIRLLDFANDKVPPFLKDQPAGLKALLDNRDALAAQLRAILDAGRGVDVRIMVPMVTTAADLRAVRAAVSELGAPAIPVGAMVETVAAVTAIDELCTVADFFSIGTNDLTAQVLDLDRTDPRARPELTAHPYVLDLIARVVTGARLAHRPVSVCGDAGAHPTTLPLLLGAGVRHFSVACARIDETRYRLLRLDTAACAGIFAEALAMRDAEETATLVRQRIGVTVP
ncbi:MAG: phosphoenolpyruvate--protein phosphotransferase [Actinobacteria bacterium]|nr:MAG: phosphoenolpyruvate--protein phosphotransferase [Actinomycetota bacterium]